ncbi:hypothetical protein L218DRAFT_1080051 [Marasmius fiardii PR-910]|nr:hypothetical protein L218DRAFT_1080051 [Marasmius fiardii PR-910]
MTSKSNLDWGAASFNSEDNEAETSSPWLDDFTAAEVVETDDLSLDSDAHSSLLECFQSPWLDDIPSSSSTGLVQDSLSSLWLSKHDMEFSASTLHELFENSWIDDQPSTAPVLYQSDMSSSKSVEDIEGNEVHSLESSDHSQLPEKPVKPAPEFPVERQPKGTVVGHDGQSGFIDDSDIPASHSRSPKSNPTSFKPSPIQGRPPSYDEPLPDRCEHEENVVKPDIQTSSPVIQHNFQGARGVTMSNAVFNSVGRDQINQNVYHGSDLLWEAVRNVGASHNSELQVERGNCLPGTREAVLRLIREWIVSRSPTLPVCWLSGAAGVGKSAIALTAAQECEKDGLVASFFFFRSDLRRNTPTSLFLSIAHGLVVSRPHLKSLVNQRIASNPNILEARLEDQYKELILEHVSIPLSEPSPDLVIIDGLDECSNAVAQRRILSIIFSTYQQPSHPPLRYLICSRPESWIQEIFDSHKSRSLTRHIKLDDSFRPRYDIELYFDKHFRDIRMDHKYSQIMFPDPWPRPEDVQVLVEKADGQFIYATTVIKFITTEFALPTDQLYLILVKVSHKSPASESPQSPFHDLDELYLIILHANPDHNKHLLPILAAILLLSEPCPAYIELLLGQSPGTVILNLHAMHSVLAISHDRQVNISIYHKSFTDFLCDSARSKEFFIDKCKWGNILGSRWLRALSEQCKADPELLSSYGSSLTDPYAAQYLMKEWEEALYLYRRAKKMSQPDESSWLDEMSNELKSELDNFYHTVLTISSQSGLDTLLRTIAAIYLFPTHAPSLIQLFLGLQKEDLAQRLRPLHRIVWAESLYSKDHQDMPLHVHYTFWDFISNRSRAGIFFIDKDYYSNLFALCSLQLLQTSRNATYQQNDLLYNSWTDICVDVKDPSQELLSEIVRMDLGNLMNRTMDMDSGLNTFMSRLRLLFSGFEILSTWLKSKPSIQGVVDHFETVQKGFHLQSTKQDIKSGLHDDITALIILSVVDWIHPGDYRRLHDVLNHYYSIEGCNLARSKLSLATFCSGQCSNSIHASDSISTLIPGTTDLYHINIQTGCLQILNVLVADLKSTQISVKVRRDIVDSLLVYSSLLTKCPPRPKVLPLLQTVLDTAKELGRRSVYHQQTRDDIREMRGKLLAWLKHFPAQCIREVEAIRSDIFQLYG